MREIGEDVGPHEPDPDHRRGDDAAVDDQVRAVEVLAAQVVEDRRQLQADEDEQERVEQEDEDLPHRVALHAHGRVGQARGLRAHVEADRDRGGDAGEAELLGRQVGGVAAHERDRDLDRRIVEALAHLGDHPADGEADRGAAEAGVDELRTGLPGAEAAGEHGRDRDLVGDQRGRVVDQRLALDDRHDAARDAEAPGDRGRGDGVGGGDDRAEHERGGPRHAVDHRVGDHRDAAGGGEHEPDRERADRPDVLPQLPQPGEVRRRVEQRRQEDQQHEVWLELEVRDARDEPEPEPAEDEEDGIRHVEHARRRDQNGHREQQPDEHKLGVRARCGHLGAS